VNAAEFQYAAAKSVGDAVRALARADGTKLIAGGQSLVPLMRLRLARPERLLDIGGLPDLRGIRPARGGLRIGAATTYREILDSALVAERLPLLAETIEKVADPATRNRATIGGGLAHADPAMDTPAALLALGAAIGLRSAEGTRVVPARDWFVGPFSTAMGERELLTHVEVPFPARRSGAAYVKFEQAASGYPIAGAAALVVRSRKTITEASLALTGVSATPFLVASAATLVGTKGEPEAVARVASECVGDREVLADVHAPAAYRRHLAAVAVRRALEAAIARGG
jgi:carbon-monoxide dehydrogenase medium subunit